jgi:16S rRNA (uracil1498-N3)-methyltransferase
VVPEVRPARTLDDYLSLDLDAVRLVLAPGAEERLSGLEPAAAIDLIVGPEGGFSDAELSLMAAAGARPVSLGPRILRTETAAPAAVAILQAIHGDL